MFSRRQVADNHVISGTLAGTTATQEPHLCNPNNLSFKHFCCELLMSRLGGVIQVTLAGGNPQLESME
jgi:hypothetical protein